MRLRSRFIALLVAAVVAAGAFGAGAAAADPRLVVDGVDTSEYPMLSLSVHLPPELVGSAAPAVAVWENDVAIDDVTVDTVADGGKAKDTVLLIDVSGSMRGEPLQNAKSAARRFVSEMGPGDRAALVSFSGKTRQVVGFSQDRAALAAAIGALEASGETALYDGMVLASRLVSESQSDSRYIVVLSDGGDTVSGASLDHAADAVRGAECVVYAVALLSPEYDAAPLKALTANSGGRLAASEKPEALTELFAGIAEEMRSVYTIRLTSREPNSKEIELRLELAADGKRAEGIAVFANPAFAPEVAAASAPASLPLASGWASLLAGVISLLAFSSASLGAWLGFSHLAHRSASPVDSLAHYTLAGAGDFHESAVSDRSRALGLVDSIATQRGFTELIRERIERAGLSLRPLEFIYFHFLAVLVSGMAAWFGSRNVMLFLMVIVCATAGPLLALNFLAARRRNRFHAQLPDILALMAGSLRTGWALQQSLDLVVQQSSEPVRTEFARAQAQVRLGMSLEEALSSVAERLDSADFRWVVTAVGIQREVGGNLAEVLDTVAFTIRERSELRRHVSSLTAEGRFSALVLVIMPFVVVAAMSIVSPEYISPMFSSGVGWMLMATGGVLLIVGSLWLLKLMKVEV